MNTYTLEQATLTKRQHDLAYLALCEFYKKAEAGGHCGLAQEISDTQDILGRQNTRDCHNVAQMRRSRTA